MQVRGCHAFDSHQVLTGSGCDVPRGSVCGGHQKNTPTACRQLFHQQVDRRYDHDPRRGDDPARPDDIGPGGQVAAQGEKHGTTDTEDTDGTRDSKARHHKHLYAQGDESRAQKQDLLPPSETDEQVTPEKRRERRQTHQAREPEGWRLDLDDEA